MRKTATLVWRSLGLAALLYAGWTGYAGYGEDPVVKVKLREYVFHIPERYSLSRITPFWLEWMLKSIPGLDDSSATIRFKVPKEEVSRMLPAYRFRPNEDFTAILAVLSDEEVARYHDPYFRHSDIWYGTGSYKGRRVEPFGETGWYRVYHPLETESWEVFRQYPDANTPVPDDPLSFDVASCHAIVDLKTTSCLTDALHDRIAIDFWTAEENLVLIDELRVFLIAKVLEWKQPD